MSKASYSVDLRPDKNLLDPDSRGYKLSLDPVPVYHKSTSSGVDYIQPNDDQFSFGHVKLFSLHNHLHVNPFTNSIYFVDKNWNVVKIVLSMLNKLQDLRSVWTIPSPEPGRKRMYNVSLAFASHDLVVLSDGAGTAHVISVNFQDNAETWTKVSSEPLCDTETSFIISSVSLQTSETRRLLHVVVMHIDEKRDKAKEVITTSWFHTIIEWVTLALEQDAAEWKRKCHKKLEAYGNVEYISLEPGCKALYVIGDKAPKWTYDSENPVIEGSKETEQADEKVEKLYTWSQGPEEIVMRIPTDGGDSKEYEIKVESTKMRIKLRGEELISGDFPNRVDGDLTVWSFEENELKIHLMKQEVGLMWQSLLAGDDRGEQIYDRELVGQVHEQLAHLCSDKEVDPGQPSFNTQQLEECDLASCSTAALVRMASDGHAATHEVSLSSFQWLFKIQCHPKKVPAICLRHDVDACVWQFGRTDADAEQWPYKHIGTFSAFGYVQASKAQRKYLTCSPDLSYATICEGSRYIYLYRQPSPVEGELRNRASGEKIKSVAKQQLVTLATNEQILGVHATNSLMFVLTENIVHALQVNE